LTKSIKNKTITLKIEENVYQSLPCGFDPAVFGFACPIGLKNCGMLDEIRKQSARKNVFIAIPYSDYQCEKPIVDLIVAAGLEPKLAKQKIQTQVILCKICRNIRKSRYGIADISKNNSNVAYELGLMQSLGRCCAILLEEGAQRQNDLQGLENVVYKDPENLKQELGRWLFDNVKEIDKEALNKYLKTKSS
jgi:hypothetical protein